MQHFATFVIQGLGRCIQTIHSRKVIFVLKRWPFLFFKTNVTMSEIPAQVTVSVKGGGAEPLSIEIDANLDDAREIIFVLAQGLVTISKHGESQDYKEHDLIAMAVSEIEKAFVDPTSELV